MIVVLYSKMKGGKLNMKSRQKLKNKNVVFACAWCSPLTYKPLKKDQEYTHGICAEHKQKLLVSFKGMSNYRTS